MSVATVPVRSREEASAPASSRITTRERVVVSALALAFLATLIALAFTMGVTVDEPAHFLSGRLYWEGRDNLRPGDMPPLLKIVSGWVPLVMRAPLPLASHPAWRDRNEWVLAIALMERLSAAQVKRYFFAARLPMLVFPLGCFFLIWWWGRQIFAPWAAVAAACLFCLDPLVLAHGHLVKNDLAAAFAYLLFWYRAWRFWRAPRCRNAAWLGVGALAGVLAKFSLAILLPLAPAILAARYLLRRDRRNWGRLAVNWIVCAAVVYVGVVAAWQFRSDPVSPAEFQAWQASGGAVEAAARVVRAASGIPLPGAFWRGGMSLVVNNRDTSPYLLGQTWHGGHWLYFLVALAVKVPVPIQILVLIALCSLAGMAMRRRLRPGDWCWLLPGFLYLGLASCSSLQLGMRLVLPALVFLLFASARAFEVMRGSAKLTLAMAALLLLLAGETARAYPNYIPYFNLWGRDSWHGVRILSDSNVDWGQGLRQLQEWYRTAGIARFNLSYFGTENVLAYFNDRQIKIVYPPWNDLAAQGHTRYQPAPGYYAISATLLSGQLFAPRYRDYFAVFRDLQPVKRVAESIFIYRIPE